MSNYLQGQILGKGAQTRRLTRLPKIVGSPMDNEIISFSGFGFKLIDSTMFRIGLNVFLAIDEQPIFDQPEFWVRFEAGRNIFKLIFPPCYSLLNGYSVVDNNS